MLRECDAPVDVKYDGSAGRAFALHLRPLIVQSSWLLHDSETYSEIDLIESVSFLSRNEITLYTGPNPCSMEARKGSGDVFSTRCDYKGGGCGATAPNGTFGDTFNRNGGGVLATQIAVRGHLSSARFLPAI